MDQQRARKTYKYQLMPTPEQERTLAMVVWRCRELYTADLQERKAAWEKCRVCVSFAMQSAQLPAIKAVRPDYRDRNAQALQDVLHRLDSAFAACFCRLQAGERPGYPRFQGTDRSTTASPLRRSARTAVRRWTARCCTCRRSGVSVSASGCIAPCRARPRP
jgi:transposase